MRCFLVFLSLILVTQEPIDGFKRPKGSKCKERTPVDVNDDWFFKFANEGMDNPMGTRYSLKQGFSAPPMPDDDPTLKHKMCMTADFKVGLSTFPLTVVFRYNRINEFRAYVQTEGTPAEKAFKLYGDFVMAKTDNSSYILFFGCIFETQEFWQVHTPTGTELSENATKAIYKHLKKNDFSTDKGDISSSKDPIWLEGAKVSNCTGKSGIEGALGNLPKTSGKKSKGSGSDSGVDETGSQLGFLDIISGFLSLGGNS